MVSASLFRIHLTSLLALVVLVLGMATPAMSLADTFEDYAPDECARLAPNQGHAPATLFSVQDPADETPDLEQLLKPFENLTISPETGTAAFPSPRGLLPPHLTPPRLRPPIFLA